MSQTTINYSFHFQLIKLLFITLSIGYVASIELSPRLYQSGPAINHYNVPDKEEPYVISIQQAPSLSLGTNSSGILTLSLNRAYPKTVIVLVECHSNDLKLSFWNPIRSNKSRTGFVVFKENTFGDVNLEFETEEQVGHAIVVAQVANKLPIGYQIDDSSAYLSVNIYRVKSVNIWIDIVGWIYFFAWSVSFYFQVVLNYKRQSVVGLNLDFLALNLLGFTFYFIYNYSLMFSKTVQDDYFHRNNYSRIPVEYNDLFMAAHALVLSGFTFVQYFYYQKMGFRKTLLELAYYSKGFIGIAVIIALVLYVMHFFNLILLLDVVMYLSSVKLIISIIKYSPQAYLNYSRKATSGWSIDNILLDFTGGTFSMLQMILISYNYNEWQSFFLNFTKFGLSVVSIGFDILFMIQHYILYKYDDDTQNIDAVINESVLAPSNEQQSDE